MVPERVENLMWVGREVSKVRKAGLASLNSWIWLCAVPDRQGGSNENASLCH